MDRNTFSFVALLALLPLVPIQVADGAPDQRGSASPVDGEAVPFRLGEGTRRIDVWGKPYEKFTRAYFNEFLPAVFTRKLVLEAFDVEDNQLEWIFTGDHGGFTVTIKPGKVQVMQRFYDSFGHNELAGEIVRPGRHPEKVWRTSESSYSGDLREARVEMDHRLGLVVSINGQEVVRQVCELDVGRHQLLLTENKGVVSGKMVKPLLRDASVRIDGSKKRQKMLGFGGIGTPTAYAQLSPEGKRRWWELVCEYNLLIQREYPIGTQLNPEMDNWERLEDALPHYYGDNFPNGEICDFDYIKDLRQLGGKVLFEFWKLPPWATRERKDADGKLHHIAEPESYARAMVGYCKASVERTGLPPDIVGVQNERGQPAHVWNEMVLTLRRELNRAGLAAVRIHSPDAGALRPGIDRTKALKQFPAAWDTIDYSATHMYDFQNFFKDPDGYDAMLREWAQLTADKPFLSTELCINKRQWQWPTYRVALAMGQLYHKNLTITQAVAICYCWTLLNVVQPSYGWTRTLFVPDRAHGFVPVPSSHQLRVLGAYSRRIPEGMVRLEAEPSTDSLLASAFGSEGGKLTVILLNRSTAPMVVGIEGVRVKFDVLEIADPYRENEVRRLTASVWDGNPPKFLVEPGQFVTLSNVPLRKLRGDFSVGD